jgi:hypothetical protein
MKRIFSFGVVVVLTAVIITGIGVSLVRAAPQSKVKLLKKPLKPLSIKKAELKLMQKWKTLAKPADSRMKLLKVPVTKVDYSQYVTFRRNQDGWGGCFHYAALHIIDILNEWEHPYTPDVSFRYLEYWGTRRFNQMPPGERERWAQQWTLSEDGLCSEANLFSNYDASKLIGTGKDENKDGKEDLIWDHVLFKGATPKPTAANDAEAKLYRVNMSVDYIPSVNTIRSFLCEYGPVWAAGMFSNSLGLKDEGHVIAIVGFDDNTRRFKCLNSFGDKWNGTGYFYLTYDQVATDLWNVRYIKDIASKRAGGPYAFSARIRIQHSRRNTLSVKIGVIGKQPKVVWDQPNQKNLLDYSGELNIDVPLPEYAASHWPPNSSKNCWYLQVTDHNKDCMPAAIREFTLARLYETPNNYSIGRLQVETFKPEKGALPKFMTDKDTASVNVPKPTAETPKKPLFRFGRSLYRIRALKLKADRYNVPGGTKVTLEASLTQVGNKPVKGGKITFVMRHVPRLGYRNRPETYVPIGSGITGPDGKCKFVITATPLASVYAAAQIDESGTVLVSSGWLTIGPLVK